MDHLDNDAKLTEEKVSCSDPLKLHNEADSHLDIQSIQHKPNTTDAQGVSVQKGISLEPKTPNPNQKNVEVVRDAKTSSTFISSPLRSIHCCVSPPHGGSFVTVEVDTSENGSPKTPRGVFDPFAPGPEELERAPICKKVVKISRNFTPRRLKFDDFDESLEHRNQDSEIETMPEELILESVYTSLLEAVLRKQAEEFLAKKRPSYTATVKTPPDRKLTGTADTCPAAPIKTTTSKSSNTDMVRRKLEF